MRGQEEEEEELFTPRKFADLHIFLTGEGFFDLQGTSRVPQFIIVSIFDLITCSSYGQGHISQTKHGASYQFLSGFWSQHRLSFHW